MNQAKTSLFTKIGTLVFLGCLLLLLFNNKKNPQNNPPPKGTIETTLFLSSNGNDQGKINKLGQKRSLKKIQEKQKTPQEITFGEDQPPAQWDTYPTKERNIQNNPFPPLMSVAIKGKKGKLSIEGDIFTQKFEKTVDKDEIIDIYPEYEWYGNPTSPTWENIQLIFIDQAGASIKQNIKLEWSGDNEIFLSDNCLPHLAELTDTKANPIIQTNIKKLNPSSTEITNWIKDTTKSLEPYELTYEEIVDKSLEEEGWQEIRTPQAILKEGRGNCLDLSIFWAGMMLSQNLQVWIVILPEHALIAVGPPNSGPEEAIPLETTWLTGKHLSANQVETALNIGQNKIQEELKKDPKNVKLININYWKQFFKTQN